MSNNDSIATPALSRRDVLKLGLGGAVSLAVLGVGTKFAFAADKQVLMVAHPLFDQDWSPLRGGGTPFRWNSLWWASAAYFDADNKIHPYVFASWSGSADANQAGRYFYHKALSNGEQVTCEVLVYPLEVRKVAEKWKERRQRTRKWVTPGEASRMVNEPELCRLIMSFGAVHAKFAA